jgi:hypothetical protein
MRSFHAFLLHTAHNLGLSSIDEHHEPPDASELDLSEPGSPASSPVASPAAPDPRRGALARTGRSLSLNDIQKTKPPYSFTKMIGMALLEGKDKLPVGDIYSFIESRFPYYRGAKKCWRNSVRHNLSLNKYFIKYNGEDKRRGAHWTFGPGMKDRMVRELVLYDAKRRQKLLQQEKKTSGRRASSAGLSPKGAPHPLARSGSLSQLPETPHKASSIMQGSPASRSIFAADAGCYSVQPVSFDLDDLPLSAAATDRPHHHLSQSLDLHGLQFQAPQLHYQPQQGHHDQRQRYQQQQQQHEQREQQQHLNAPPFPSQQHQYQRQELQQTGFEQQQQQQQQQQQERWAGAHTSQHTSPSVRWPENQFDQLESALEPECSYEFHRAPQQMQQAGQQQPQQKQQQQQHQQRGSNPRHSVEFRDYSGGQPAAEGHPFHFFRRGSDASDAQLSTSSLAESFSSCQEHLADALETARIADDLSFDFPQNCYDMLSRELPPAAGRHSIDGLESMLQDSAVPSMGLTNDAENECQEPPCDEMVRFGNTSSLFCSVFCSSEYL